MTAACGLAMTEACGLAMTAACGLAMTNVRILNSGKSNRISET